MTIRWRLMLLLLAVFVIAAASDMVSADKPTPPPFAVKYRIKFLKHSELNNTSLDKVNLSGIAFGNCSNKGYLFDSVTGHECWDIRSLVPSHLVPAEITWEQATLSVAAISDLGRITGTMRVSDSSVVWAYVLETNNNLIQPCTTFTLIDDLVLTCAAETRGLGVNDNGDVLGWYLDSATHEYHLFVGNLQYDPMTWHLFDDLSVVTTCDLRTVPQLNSLGQVAGQLVSGEGFRYTPGAPPTIETFLDNEGDAIKNVNDLNDLGVISGTMLAPKSVKGIFWCPYRCYPGYDVPEPVANIGNYHAHPVRINSSCDLLAYDGIENPLVYHDASKYRFFVQDLVDVSDLTSGDRAIWESRDHEWGVWLCDMTDRFPDPGELNQLGRLCGRIGFDVGTGKKKDRVTLWYGVVLTPEYP